VPRHKVDIKSVTYDFCFFLNSRKNISKMSFHRDEPDYGQGHQLQDMPSTPTVSTNGKDTEKSELSLNVKSSIVSFLLRTTTMLINTCLIFDLHHATETSSPNMKLTATMLLLQYTASLKVMRRIRLEYILLKLNGKATVGLSNTILILPVASPSGHHS
jgi:hypothetical protein